MCILEKLVAANLVSSDQCRHGHALGRQFIAVQPN